LPLISNVRLHKENPNVRDFPQAQPGAQLGTLMNLVRARIREIKEGQSVAEVLAAIGVPDYAERGVSGWLPALAEEQLADLGSMFINLARPSGSETFVYLNPYREGLTHRVAFAEGKVSRVWEASSVPRSSLT
jgi:hypothetical protein